MSLDYVSVGASLWATPGDPTSSLLELLDELAPEWMADARCIDADPEAFFPEKGATGVRAARICATCPVRGDCLEFAVGERLTVGVFGGLSPGQRSRVDLLG